MLVADCQTGSTPKAYACPIENSQVISNPCHKYSDGTMEQAMTVITEYSICNFSLPHLYNHRASLDLTFEFFQALESKSNHTHRPTFVHTGTSVAHFGLSPVAPDLDSDLPSA